MRLVFALHNCFLLLMGTSEKTPVMKASLEKLRVLLTHSTEN